MPSNCRNQSHSFREKKCPGTAKWLFGVWREIILVSKVFNVWDVLYIFVFSFAMLKFYDFKGFVQQLPPLPDLTLGIEMWLYAGWPSRCGKQMMPSSYCALVLSPILGHVHNTCRALAAVPPSMQAASLHIWSYIRQKREAMHNLKWALLFQQTLHNQ